MQAAEKMMTEQFRSVLRDFAPNEAILRMVAHWQLVRAASAEQNLTGISDPTEAATMLYLDACIVARLLRPGGLVDFGSGAGFPGLVFAALDPSREVALVEPRRLRVAFLRDAVAHLGWTQVQVHAGKVQQAPPKRFANAVCRAVFAHDDDLAQAEPWLLFRGQLLSFRGASAPLNDRAGGLRRAHSEPYEVGGKARRVDVWTRAG